VDTLRVLLQKLRRLLASRGRSADDIDDLVQEAFLRLQLYCREQPVRNTEAFMVRTVLNLSAQQGRDARRRQSMTDDPDIFSVIDPTPSPDEVYAHQQRLLKVKAGLERLRARTREAFLMHRVDGMSYVQIAQALGVSVSMVEKHIARASFFMRDWMARSPL
jgi:RNA polymerase sigma-70 factor (ECF subfamily)